MLTRLDILRKMRNESAENRSVEIAKDLLQLGKLTFEEIASSAGLTIEKDLEKTLVWHIENFLMEHGNESKGYENT